uniref:Uncharacterized protein n=1 Tax=Mola mola TaxID=94237 RepID=A0A3Q3WAN8_MOLML
MARLVLEQLSDFGDYSGSKELTEVFKATNNELKNSLANVRLSPDGRHIHVIQNKATVRLVTFDKYESPKLLQNQKKLDLWITRTVPVVDILYLGRNDSSSGDAAVVAVVYEDGRAEFWKFQLCRTGWILLQTSDLCNSPRARVVSVCACSNLIIWCEERPPSESSPALSSARNKLRYCVCRRNYEVEEGAVSLGGVKIALHNNPKFTVLSSGECVHLLPDSRGSTSTFLLSWSLHDDSFTVSTTCQNTPLKRLSAKDSDFKRLVMDCLVYFSTLDPPEIYNFSPTACGGLLLLFSTGWVCLLQKDGILRQVYKLANSCFAKCGTHTSLCLYEDTLALLIGQNLHLIDVKCGRELETITLKREGLLYLNQSKRCTPHLLSKTGLFVVVNKETASRESLLVEAVFEEACKYYQQRSLSSTRLTVEVLKKGGRFQAPISLACILRNYLSTGSKQKGAELSQSGEVECTTGLVEKEVVRLLSSPELDKESLLYLNSIFSMFPCQVWRAAQAALQLYYNGEGSLSSRAPPDVWKTVLSPTAAPTPPAVLPVFELLCQSVFHFQPTWLPRFLELSQKQQGSASRGLTLASSSWGLPGGRGRESGEKNMPLYKRALCILSSLSPGRDQHQDLEVELLLVSGRPNAILQALRILMAKQQWERVTQVAQEFCKQSPLLNKEIFTTLLCEVAHHRDLDPYLDLLWVLCPEDLTVTTILNLVLKNLSSPNTPPSSSSSSSFSMSSTTSLSPAPFADSQSSQLTIGLLKPLLRKVLQRETKPSQHYADILQSPSFPPPAPPRQPRAITDPNKDSALDGNYVSAPLVETPEQQSSTHATVPQAKSAATC